jgi:hypothetical protein
MFVARRFVEVVVSAGMLVGLLVVSRGDDAKTPARPQTLRDGFETDQPVWQREYTDTTVNLLAQERSNRAAHEGRLSERFQFEAGPGSQFFVSYATPKVPVSDLLSVGLYVRSNRTGVRIFGRVVLPSDIDPETKAPSFVLVPGTIFDEPDHWQRLELLHMIPAIEQQARVLRVLSRRPVSLDGAYLERVVVNLLGSPGRSEVFLDQLEIAPVPTEALAGWTKGESSRKGAAGAQAGAQAKKAKALAHGSIRLDRNLLEKKGDDGRWRAWLPTAIDAPGASPVKLRLAGFDVLVDDMKSEPERMRAAIDKGALLMARVGGAAGDDDPQTLIEEVISYPLRREVAFWHVGDHLGRLRDTRRREAQLAKTRETIAALRGLDDDESTTTLGNVDGELSLYARAPSGLDMIGIAPRLWGSAQDPWENYTYLNQRKLLTVRSNLGGLFWAWIPASTPPEVMKNIWGDDTPPSWGTPPVQPTQLRIMTYMALANGYRGLGFTGDATLTRSGGAGRALWIEMSFLNLEIDLVEQILAQNETKIRDYSVFDPPPLPVPSNATQLANKRPTPTKEQTPRPGMIASAVPLIDRKGALLLVAEYAGGAQYQPPQLSADEVVITPNLPEGALAFEISPGEVKVLKLERTPGGRQITLKEFDTTSMILCTGDVAMYERLRTIVEGVRPWAVPLAIEQAEILLEAVTEINGRLAADGHQFMSKVDLERRRQAGIDGKPPDVPDLLAQSQTNITNAREAWERQDYAGAWAEARRASRPLRIIMHGHWAQANVALNKAAKTFYPKRPGEEEDDDLAAIKPKKKTDRPKLPRNPPLLVMPIACPPCISFFTLPEHYIWVDWIKGMPGYRFGRNRVPSGDFENPRSLADAGWVDLSYATDGLLGKVSIAPRDLPAAKKSDADAAKKESPQPDRSSSKRVIKLEVKAARPEDLDTILSPFLDFPVAAIRCPPTRVERSNFIRISVLVKRVFPSAPGMGGVIVRDSIGGEQFQFRSSGPIPEYSRVVLYRKAPGDGTFTVTLGLAGYGEAYFDDFRVEVIERDVGSAAPDVVEERRRDQPSRAPGLPDPTLPAAASRPTDSRRQQR